MQLELQLHDQRRTQQPQHTTRLQPPNSIDQTCQSFGQCLDVLAQIGLMVCAITTDGTCGFASKAAQLLGRRGGALLTGTISAEVRN